MGSCRTGGRSLAVSLARGNWRSAFALVSVLLPLLAVSPDGFAQDVVTAPDYSGEVPSSLRGPFVFEPEVITLLDCMEHDPCDGPLNFRRLIEAKAKRYEDVSHQNPFLLGITQAIRTTLVADIKEIATRAKATGFQLHPSFLSHPESRIELVGIVNRMDRQFIKDPSLNPSQRNCGEISVIYRFSYDLKNGRKSRLPVTMNIVFPALPGEITCRGVAARWVAELDRPSGRSPATKGADLLDEKSGPLALIRGEDMLRIEINAQVYRKPAAVAQDFGSEAEYLIRVFHWEDELERFESIELTNQIDREKLLCLASDKPKQCKRKEALRRELVEYIQSPAVVADIDAGTLELPQKFLARRATSMSPGGVHRARNQPFWKETEESRKRTGGSQEIISDEEIMTAMRHFRETGSQLSFIGSVEDFRTRLNDSTCTGCHQTRAIAGFHFPGADRAATLPVNSVYLPGSPLFYGDQPRRREIVAKIAERRSGKLSTYELAIGYSARPLNRLSGDFAGTQLLGGWGGACIMPQFLRSTKRQWTCQDGFVCKQFYKSQNDRMVGTCVPDGQTQIGDPLQIGTVVSRSFTADAYSREFPKAYPGSDLRNRLIDDKALALFDLPPVDANSYYGAHQEFYGGRNCAELSCSRDELRDEQTGGFPSGTLRLSECVGLPASATCGLIASTGFNACLSKMVVPGSGYTLETCFRNFTSFAGMRACDAASPCRDDYICVSPMVRAGEDFEAIFTARAESLASQPYFKQIVGKPYAAADYYGQVHPDEEWLTRQDRRGLCIPPYFVFQFRADKHPQP
jgi:hypothetical protein